MKGGEQQRGDESRARGRHGAGTALRTVVTTTPSPGERHSRALRGLRAGSAAAGAARGAQSRASGARGQPAVELSGRGGARSRAEPGRCCAAGPGEEPGKTGADCHMASLATAEVMEVSRHGARTGGGVKKCPNGRRSRKLASAVCSWWGFLWLASHVSAAAAQDDVAPYFKTELGAAQIHLEGNRLVLTCLAEGSWPLEFKWMLNGTDITAFSPEYKYTIPSLQRSHAGFYQCVVRNRMGVLMQKRTEVQVAYMGNFVEQEQRKTVAQGKAAVLNCPAIRSFPRPQVTWFRDGYKIIPSEKVAITLDNQLVVLATVASDAGRYYVQAVNERNGENKTSPSTYLSIAEV